MRGKDLRRLPAGLARALLHDAPARRHLGHWLRSLRSGSNPLEDPVPLVTYGALEWLEAHLDPDARVFEWGSGASTLYLAARVGELVSVEHDPVWHHRVGAALKERGIDGCRQVLAEPEPSGPETPPELVSGRRRWRGLSFERYVASIDGHPEGHFDLVCVDGRQRVACGLRALSRIRPDGHLLLDNADRDDYAPLRTALAGCEVHDFDGLGPGQARPWRTTVWRIGGGG